MPRKKHAPAPAMTPEQAAKAAAREEAREVYYNARSSLLSAAREMAERLAPGRVSPCLGFETFTVSFGRANTFRDGAAELQVSLKPSSRLPNSDEFPPPGLELSVRPFYADAGLDSAADLGAAILDAVALGRVLLALIGERR